MFKSLLLLNNVLKSDPECCWVAGAQSAVSPASQTFVGRSKYYIIISHPLPPVKRHYQVFTTL